MQTILVGLASLCILILVWLLRSTFICQHRIACDISLGVKRDPDFPTVHINELRLYCKDCGETIFLKTDTDISNENYSPIDEAKRILER